MEATTTRRRTATPFTKAWNQAKKLDNSEKLELVAMLIDSVKPAVAEPRKPRLYDPETGEYLNDETINYSAIGSTADIWLSRTLKTGSWNTFASPVAIDADQLTALGITAVKQLGTSVL